MDFEIFITYAKDARDDITITCTRYIVENGLIRFYKPIEIAGTKYRNIMEYSINLEEIEEFRVVSLNESNET